MKTALEELKDNLAATVGVYKIVPFHYADLIGYINAALSEAFEAGRKENEGGWTPPDYVYEDFKDWQEKHGAKI